MPLKPEVGTTDHCQGNANAELTIVEFGDYQCPHCGAAYPIVKEILDTFGQQIRFVFRNFPLAEAHPYARAAACAAEAAGLQGSYWEMHDAIYEKQSLLDHDFLIRLAETLGLDLARFKADCEAVQVQEKVALDFESGIRSGVNGTPAFFINGTRFDGGATDLYAVLQENTN